MTTVPELLRFEIEPGQTIQIVLRSGQHLAGEVEDVDLIADIVQLGGWTVRIPEIAGVKIDDESDDGSSRLRPHPDDAFTPI